MIKRASDAYTSDAHMRHRLLRIVFALVLPVVFATGVCGADVVADIVSTVPAKARSYTQCMEAISRLDGSQRIVAERIGHSVKGRPIVLVACRSEKWANLQPWEGPPRLLVIARQHGTESSGTEAALALLDYFANTADETSCRILEQLTIVAIPMANPDGVVASRRANGAGVDLNRDWSAQTQPETRAIVQAVERWQPSAVIDLHELPARSSNPLYAQSFVETMGRDAQVCTRLSDDTCSSTLQLTGWLKSYGFPANVYYNSSASSRALCHRYFNLVRSIPAYLFEAKTGSGHPLHARVTYHILGSLVVGNHLIHNYYDAAPTETTAVAEAPEEALPVQAEDEATPEAELELTILQPEDGVSADDTLPVVARIRGEGFAYVSFSVNGVLKAVTTSEPYQYFLNPGQYDEGPQRVQVAVCDDMGRTLAAGERTVVVSRATREGR